MKERHFNVYHSNNDINIQSANSDVCSIDISELRTPTLKTPETIWNFLKDQASAYFGIQIGLSQLIPSGSVSSIIIAIAQHNAIDY